MEVFVARQPIFNMFEQIVGYELLYRNKLNNRFPNVDSDIATVDVLVNTFLSIGIDEVSQGKPTFVNFTGNLLMSTVFDYLEPTKVIVEILEDVKITTEIVTRIKELKQRGFKMALDDFILSEDLTDHEEIFQYIDYIKIDFIATPLLQRMEIENEIKAKYPHIKFLAEKVETRNQYDVAKHSGYVLFQGYFFEKPQVLSTTEIPPNVIQYLHILSLLREEEPDINILSENIERDISLTYKLLQLINTSDKRWKSKVRSIKQAVLLLGLTELRKWMYLLAMREARLDTQNDTKKEIIVSSLFRAKICEKFASYKYKENHSEYFLIGLFSLIDGILERPLPTILQQLPFSEDIIETISGVDTYMTPYLNLSIALNKADWSKVEIFADELKIPYDIVMQYYEEVNEWVKDSFDHN
jgi:c-di-GMP phosphodiesterase